MNHPAMVGHGRWFIEVQPQILHLKPPEVGWALPFCYQQHGCYVEVVNSRPHLSHGLSLYFHSNGHMIGVTAILRQAQIQLVVYSIILSFIFFIYTGWWFQTFFMFHFIYGILLPIDELIFFKIAKTTNQIFINHYLPLLTILNYTPWHPTEISFLCSESCGPPSFLSVSRAGGSWNRTSGTGWLQGGTGRVKQ